MAIIMLNCGRNLMIKAEILEVVTEIACDQFGVMPDKISLLTRYKDLGADSLDWVELHMQFEDEFEIVITDKEIDDVVTVKDSVDLISKLIFRKLEV